MVIIRFYLKPQFFLFVFDDGEDDIPKYTCVHTDLFLLRNEKSSANFPLNNLVILS